MGADPVRQRLGPARLGVSEVGGAKRGHKDAGATLDAGRRVDHGNGVASPIDEQLLAGHMGLAPPRPARLRHDVGDTQAFQARKRSQKVL